MRFLQLFALFYKIPDTHLIKKTKGETPVPPDADMKVWKVEYHSK